MKKLFSFQKKLEELENEEINLTHHFMYNFIEDEDLYNYLFKDEQDKNVITVAEKNQFETLFNNFKNLSYENKHKKIKSIKLFTDGCTTWEPEFAQMYNRRNMVHNFIMLSYLEILLKEKKEVDIICWVDENLLKVRERFDDIESNIIESHKKNYFQF